jgi:hypothetical protein
VSIFCTYCSKVKVYCLFQCAHTALTMWSPSTLPDILLPGKTGYCQHAITRRCVYQTSIWSLFWLMFDIWISNINLITFLVDTWYSNIKHQSNHFSDWQLIFEYQMSIWSLFRLTFDIQLALSLGQADLSKAGVPSIQLT